MEEIMQPNNTRELNDERAKALKHVAIQIVGLLPSDQREAELVLAYARRLVVDFLNHDGLDLRSGAEGNVLAFKV
jgi:hypothetical protein